MFYFYAVIKDYGDGSHYRANDWYKQTALSDREDSYDRASVGSFDTGMGIVNEDGVRGASNSARRARLANLTEEMSKARW